MFIVMNAGVWLILKFNLILTLFSQEIRMHGWRRVGCLFLVFQVIMEEFKGEDCLLCIPCLARMFMSASHADDCTLSPKGMSLFLIPPILRGLIKYWLEGRVKVWRSW